MMSHFEGDVKMDRKKLANAELSLDNQTKDFEKLKNKKIVDIGFIKGVSIEGGLAIDYEDAGEIKRIVMGFTELGAWVEWHGLKDDCSEFVLREKIEKFHDYITNKSGWKSLKIENKK